MALAQTGGQRGEMSRGHSSVVGCAIPPHAPMVSCTTAAYERLSGAPFMLPTPHLGYSAASSLTRPLKLLIKQQGGLFIEIWVSCLVSSRSVR